MKDDALVDDRIERVSHTVRDVAETIAWSALAGVAIVVCGLALWLAPVIRSTAAEVRDAAAEQREFLKRQSDGLDGKGAELVDAARAAADDVHGLVGDIRREVVPSIRAAADAAAETASRGPGFVDEARGLVADSRETAATATSLVAHADDAIVADQAELLATLGQLEQVSEHVVVITSPEQLEPVRAALLSTAAHIDATSGRLEVVAANGVTVSENAAAVSTHYRERLLPAPYTPSGGPFVRGLKRTGRYALQVLKASPQLAIVAVKLATGP